MEGSLIIVVNDNAVETVSLTWLTYNGRVKMYNKFACQVTSLGVGKDIVNHIIDSINCQMRG